MSGICLAGYSSRAAALLRKSDNAVVYREPRIVDMSKLWRRPDDASLSHRRLPQQLISQTAPAIPKIHSWNLYQVVCSTNATITTVLLLRH